VVTVEPALPTLTRLGSLGALLHALAYGRFGQAKLLCERLGGVCGEVNKPLYVKKLEDIDAQIRYCSFMLGGSASELDVRGAGYRLGLTAPLPRCICLRCCDQPPQTIWVANALAIVLTGAVFAFCDF